MTPAMSSDSPFLDVPILPFEVDARLTGREILERMGGISFQGRNLAAAHAAWRAMLRDNVLIFLGTAGALSAGGLRLVLAYMVTHRYVDCVVTTGANLYHDLHETLGRHHYRGHPREDDEALKRDHVDRIYDTYASEDEFCENDTWIARLHSQTRTPTTHDARIPLQAGGTSLDNHPPGWIPHRRLPGSRADLLPGAG